MPYSHRDGSSIGRTVNASRYPRAESQCGAHGRTATANTRSRSEVTKQTQEVLADPAVQVGGQVTHWGLIS